MGGFVKMLQRRKEEQIVLEARVDRLEKNPSWRARQAIPTNLIRPADSSSPSAPSDSSEGSS